MNRRLALSSCCITLLLLVHTLSWTQPQLPTPQPSQKATISQTVGVSEIEVIYHRPGVKGRPVWGSLVPDGEVWRAGANENTTVRFSTPVTVGGKTLPAGIYGLHMLPTKGDFTVIFSNNATSWGSYFYKDAEDALRVSVTPQPTEHHEWLQYEFSDLTDSTAVLALSWEKVRVPIPLKFNTDELVLATVRDSYLRGLAGFGWQGFNQAAAYCARRGINLPEALQWADQSVRLNENFTNLRTKATILEKLGRAGEAAPLRDRAMRVATEADINILGYTYLNANQIKEALEVFRKNVKDHPDSWNVYDSLAEGLEKSGDAKGAIENYQKALKLVGDERNKERIQKSIAQLKSKAS